jgi:hypothetical protein
MVAGSEMHQSVAVDQLGYSTPISQTPVLNGNEPATPLTAPVHQRGGL